MKFTFFVVIFACVAMKASADPWGYVRYHVLNDAPDVNNGINSAVNAVKNVKDQVVSTVSNIDWNPFHAISNAVNYLEDQYSIKDQVVSTVSNIDWNPFHAISNAVNYLEDQY